ncbi:hypothetical protein [Bacillus niameyensis]|uniref:hypothetical protein n=1 Tax=Bacillus niameyensis TaxID=1522308 RepID=UPI0007835823|nr:hypothetical protein [Bacillus niameyensis]
MEKEDQILDMLYDIKGILTEHSAKLNEHTRILNEHSQILNEHTQKLKEHDQKFAESKQILDALRYGQEGLKAEISELRLQNAKDIEETKKRTTDAELSLELLKEETWGNKKDIRRIQKTIGIA